jgi:osmoprotectant transport system permease protein
MSATTTAPPTTTSPGDDTDDQRTMPVWLRYVGTPLALVVVTVLTLQWVFSQELLQRDLELLNAERIIQETLQHLLLTGLATVLVLVIAIPLGIMLTRPWASRSRPLFLGIANLGQATPSIGVLVLTAVITTQVGVGVSVFALVVYATLPVLRNTMVGIEQVDEFVIDAGRGMGLSSFQVLRRIELPLAVPVMLAGVRTTLVIVVGTAALATFVGGDGLGLYINNGIKLSSTPVLVTGAVLTAVLALAVDWLGGIVEDVLRPRGL